MYLLSLCLTALLTIGVSASPALDRRAISCLKVGATATASWTNAAGQSCRWTGVVGSNFGANSVNGGEYAVHPLIFFHAISDTLHRYSCNGRCGAGCSGTAIGNVYTQDCFSHDVCSWFNNASGGAR
jgi:hypothetical protein